MNGPLYANKFLKISRVAYGNVTKVVVVHGVCLQTWFPFGLHISNDIIFSPLQFPLKSYKLTYMYVRADGCVRRDVFNNNPIQDDGWDTSREGNRLRFSMK